MATETEVSTLKLKDLNDDCLIKIFRCLSLNDLVRIVDFDKRFITPAKYVFGLRSGKNRFRMDNFWYKKSEIIQARTLRMLDYFGDVLTHLVVTYEDLIEPNEELGNLIIKKCQKSLIKVTFSETSQSKISELSEPFENVQAVSFEHGKLCYLISEFNKWFPKAATFSLKNINLDEHEKIQLLQQNYPGVEHFTFIETQRPHVDIHGFAELNPQIKNLTISNCVLRRVDWQDVLGTITRYLPNLQTFELLGQSYFTNYKWLPEVAIASNENGKIVNIFYADETTTELINLVIQWEELKELVFPYNAFRFESEKIMNAVLNCESLEKLSVCYRYPSTGTIFSGDWTTVKAALDDAVAVNGNKWKTNVVFKIETLHRLDYLINFERVVA